VLTAAAAFGGPAISALAVGGTAISATGKAHGVIAYGPDTGGCIGTQPFGIGVKGNTIGDTGIKAEASPLPEGGTAFEAVGPVKFSAAGLAGVGVAADRVTVNPGVPIALRARSWQLTKASARPIQIAWFLMS
jgi:hypothetical protein